MVRGLGKRSFAGTPIFAKALPLVALAIKLDFTAKDEEVSGVSLGIFAVRLTQKCRLLPRKQTAALLARWEVKGRPEAVLLSRWRPKSSSPRAISAGIPANNGGAQVCRPRRGPATAACWPLQGPYWKEELMQHLDITLADFRELSGLTLKDRLCGYYGWQSARRRDGSWAYDKTLHSAPLPNSSMVDGCGRHVKGPNYCSQDYLSLAKHDCIREAAITALHEFGAHSAGSSALLGNTLILRKLEAELAEFLGYEHVLLFPTGWAAGYGVVKCLVRSDDWVVMDALNHACLQEGARAATPKVASLPHLDNDAFERRLARIRAKYPSSLVLAVTESIF